MNSVNLILVLITIIGCSQIIWKYIIKPGMHKKFINMFYTIALLVLLSSLCSSIALLIDLPAENSGPDVTKISYSPIFFTISYSIHSTCYIGLILLQICTIIQISVGLKLTYVMKGKDHDGVIQFLRFSYFMCIFLFVMTAIVETCSLALELTADKILLFYLIFVPMLGLVYIISFVMLLYYMNTNDNPALKPERTKICFQTFYFMMSLMVFLALRIILYTQ